MLIRGKWVDLLLWLNKNYKILGDDFIFDFNDQKILKSVQFYKIMNILNKLGWIRIIETKEGCINKKQYFMSRKGHWIVEDFILEIINCETK